MWNYLWYYCGASVVVTGVMMRSWLNKYPSRSCMAMAHNAIAFLIVLGGPVTWPYMTYRTWRDYIEDKKSYKKLE